MLTSVFTNRVAFGRMGSLGNGLSDPKTVGCRMLRSPPLRMLALIPTQDADSEPVREPTPPPAEEERPYKRVKVLELEEPTVNWLPTTATAPSSDRGWWKTTALEEQNRGQLPEPSKKQAIEAVIAAARATAVAAALQKAEEEAKELARAEEKAKLVEKKQAKKERKKSSMSKEEKEALKEKNLKKMVGAVVVKTMGKYQKYMDHDQFKKYAKEVRHFPFHPPLPY